MAAELMGHEEKRVIRRCGSKRNVPKNGDLVWRWLYGPDENWRKVL